MIFRTCNICDKKRPQLGGGLRHTFGLRRWICASCKAAKK
jgi:hypothetical protein